MLFISQRCKLISAVKVASVPVKVNWQYPSAAFDDVFLKDAVRAGEERSPAVQKATAIKARTTMNFILIIYLETLART